MHSVSESPHSRTPVRTLHWAPHRAFVRPCQAASGHTDDDAKRFLFVRATRKVLQKAELGHSNYRLPRGRNKPA